MYGINLDNKDIVMTPLIDPNNSDEEEDDSPPGKPQGLHEAPSKLLFVELTLEPGPAGEKLTKEPTLEPKSYAPL